MRTAAELLDALVSALGLQSGLSDLDLVPRIIGLGFPQRTCGPCPLSHSPGPGAASAPCKPGRAAGGLVAGTESACVCLHQGPLPAPLQVCTSAGTVETGQGWRTAQMVFSKLLFGCLHFRQFRDSQAFSFCTAGHWASGQQVTRDGSGLRGVWWQQIRQFNRVSPAVADAVVTAFPSPRLLQQVSPLNPSFQDQDFRSTYSNLCPF